MMKAAVVTIGDEILIGQIVDSNSAWIASRMTSYGFEIREMVSIGDDPQQIKDTIGDAFRHVDVVLVTGGLGPTKDDLTKKTLCEYFDTELVFDDSVLETIKRVIPAARLNPLTRNQAYVPKCATIIQNEVGTAPIMWFEQESKILVSMPGVPYEMQYAMVEAVLPRLQKRFDAETYIKKVFVVVGYSESHLATILTGFESELPGNFGLAYLPSLGVMKLRLFVKGEEHRIEFDRQVKKLEEILREAILIEEDVPLEKILGLKLSEKGLTLSTAESCTGGNISRLITSISGSSHYFRGSVVSYANEVKIGILNVKHSTIDKVGAVSEDVVREMAEGVCLLMNTDCAIAVSGIAGPTGGTGEKPVGTVWICTICKEKSLVREYQFGTHRESNITRASNWGMLQLLEMIGTSKLI